MDKSMQLFQRIMSFANKLDEDQQEEFMDLIHSLMNLSVEEGAESPFGEDMGRDEDDGTDPWDEGDGSDLWDEYSPFYRGPLTDKSKAPWRLTLRIELQYIKPLIWRKIEVSSNFLLEAFHEVIINAMGWGGYHLSGFRKGNVAYATEEEMAAMPFGGDGFTPIEGLVLGDFFKKKGDTLTFEYDMGDSWIHKLTLMKDPEPAFGDEPEEIRVISGRNACPPEDFGGPWRYNDFVQCWLSGDKKKLRKEFKDILDLVDKDFDPECFDIAEAQAAVDAFLEDAASE